MKLNEPFARLRKPYACLELCEQKERQREREREREKERDYYRRSFARAGTQETRDLIIAPK